MYGLYGDGYIDRFGTLSGVRLERNCDKLPTEAGRVKRSPPRYTTAGPTAGSCVTEPVARRPFPAYVIVARGENLCRIAKRYETTVQAIVDVNRLSSPMLAVGSRLYLPSPEYYAHSPFGELRQR